MGSATAKVAILEFSDFQCPYCARFAKEVFPVLKSKYVDGGFVQFSFRHLPLPMHKQAQRAAESSACAAAQGRFWQMHDALFSKPDQTESLEEPGLVASAAATGIDMKAFSLCMVAPPTSQVQDDAKLARSLGLSGTPAFIVGAKTVDGKLKASTVLLGAQPPDAFADVIDKLLKG